MTVPFRSPTVALLDDDRPVHLRVNVAGVMVRTRRGEGALDGNVCVDAGDVGRDARLRIEEDVVGESLEIEAHDVAGVHGERRGGEGLRGGRGDGLAVSPSSPAWSGRHAARAAASRDGRGDDGQ